MDEECSSKGFLDWTTEAFETKRQRGLCSESSNALGKLVLLPPPVAEKRGVGGRPCGPGRDEATRSRSGESASLPRTILNECPLEQARARCASSELTGGEMKTVTRTTCPLSKPTYFTYASIMPNIWYYNSNNHSGRL